MKLNSMESPMLIHTKQKDLKKFLQKNIKENNVSENIAVNCKGEEIIIDYLGFDYFKNDNVFFKNAKCMKVDSDGRIIEYYYLYVKDFCFEIEKNRFFNDEHKNENFILFFVGEDVFTIFFNFQERRLILLENNFGQ